MELRTAKDVELDSLRIEVIRLKTKVRKVATDKGILDIYESFEEDTKRFLIMKKKRIFVYIFIRSLNMLLSSTI